MGKMKSQHFWLPVEKYLAFTGKIHYCPPGKNPSDTHGAYTTVD